jgi:copper(I)-binding protein
MKALALGLTFAAIAICAPAAAHQYKAGGLTIGHPWSRPAAVGMNGVGYLTVTNAGKTPDTLIAVETPAAGKADIHTGSVKGGVMRMRKLPHGLTIPAGRTATLAPGGDHLMLLKLKQPLKVGDKVPATLVFRRAGRVAVSFSVQAAPPVAKPDHRH